MNIWEGIYRDFQEIKKYNKFPKTNKTLLKKSKKIFKKNLISCQKKLNLDHDSIERFLYLPTLVNDFNSRKKIDILDFGGGFGNAFLYLKQTLDNAIFKKINYYIVEVEEICLEGKKINKDVKFLKKIPKKKFDIIFSCSAMQYVEGWQNLIFEFTKNNSKKILLSDVFCGNIKSYATLQNYYKVRLPHWMLNFQSLDSQFNNRNYKLKFIENVKATRLGHRNILPMGNFEKKFRIRYTKHLIYEN